MPRNSFYESFGSSFQQGLEIGSQAVRDAIDAQRRRKELIEEYKLKAAESQRQREWEDSTRYIEAVRKVRDEETKKKLLKTHLDKRRPAISEQLASGIEFLIDAGEYDTAGKYLIEGIKDPQATEFQYKMGLLSNYDQLDPIFKQYVDTNLLGKNKEGGGSSTAEERERARIDILTDNFIKGDQPFTQWLNSLPESDRTLMVTHGKSRYDAEDVTRLYGIKPQDVVNMGQKIIDEWDLAEQGQTPTIEEAYQMAIERLKQAGKMTTKALGLPEPTFQEIPDFDKATTYFNRLKQQRREKTNTGFEFDEPRF